MALNRYSQVADSKVASNYIPMPLDFINQQMQQRQQTFDERAAAIRNVRAANASDAVMAVDQDRAQQYTDKYETYIKENLDKVGGDYSKLSRDVAENIKADMSTGHRAEMRRNYNLTQKHLKEQQERFAKGDISKDSYSRVLSSIENFEGTIEDGAGGWKQASFYTPELHADIQDITLKSSKANADQFLADGTRYKDINELANTNFLTLKRDPSVLGTVDDMMWSRHPNWDGLSTTQQSDIIDDYLMRVSIEGADRYDFQERIKPSKSNKSEAAGVDTMHYDPFKSGTLVGKPLDLDITQSLVESTLGYAITKRGAGAAQAKDINEIINSPVFGSIAKNNPAFASMIEQATNTDDKDTLMKLAGDMQSYIADMTSRADNIHFYEFKSSKDADKAISRTLQAVDGVWDYEVISGVGVNENGKLNNELATMMRAYNGTATSPIRIMPVGTMPGTLGSYSKGSFAVSVSPDPLNKEAIAAFEAATGESILDVPSLTVLTQNPKVDTDDVRIAGAEAVDASPGKMSIRRGTYNGQGEKQLWVVNGYQKTKNGTFAPIIETYGVEKTESGESLKLRNTFVPPRGKYTVNPDVARVTAPQKSATELRADRYSEIYGSQTTK